MLSKIKLKNFQSFEELELDLEQITVLCGSSDVGKSALIRSFLMLHRNNLGQSMIRHGAKSLKIMHIFDDGSEVGIEKGEDVNKYYLKTASVDKVFSKIGREVPEEIQEFLKTQPLVLDKDQDLDLTFSLQFGGGPFLLSDSSSTITKTISALSGIHYIYSALRECAASSVKLKSKITALEDTEKGLIKFEALEKEENDLEVRFNEVEQVDKGLSKLGLDITNLESKSKKLLELTRKQIDSKPAKETHEKAQIVCNSLVVEQNIISNLEHLLGRIKKLRKIDGEALEAAFFTERFNLGYAAGLTAREKELYDLIVERDRLIGNQEKIESCNAEILIQEQEIQGLKIQEQTEKAKKKICETCGREL